MTDSAVPAAEKAALQQAFDDAVGMLLDLLEGFPPGFPMSHLAMSYEADRLPMLIPLVSAERRADWESVGVLR